MYIILSFIFLISALFAYENLSNLIGLSIVAGIFAIADSIDDHKKVLEEVRNNIFKIKEEISKK